MTTSWKVACDYMTAFQPGADIPFVHTVELPLGAHLYKMLDQAGPLPPGIPPVFMKSWSAHVYLSIHAEMCFYLTRGLKTGDPR